MRLTCSQKDLARALMITTKAVALNNTLPVLNNVLLKAEDNKLHFTGTNLEVAITCFINAKIESPGEVTLPAKLLTGYVNYLRDQMIEMELSGLEMQIKTTDSKTKIKGLAVVEFPPIPTVEKEGSFKASVKDLKKAISQVSFSAALNTTRPILTGVLWVVEGDQLKMVSTDSYRLSEKKIPVVDVSGELNCVVPCKTLLEWGAVLDMTDEVGQVEIIVSKNQIHLSVSGIQMTSRLIEGQFPNYEQIIPKSSLAQVEVETGVLSLALKRINIFAKENNNKVVLSITGDQMKLTTASTQYGEGEITLPVKKEGEDSEVAINSQYLLDVLANMGVDKIRLEAGEKTAPIIIKPTQDAAYLHIIMPLKI